MKKKDLPPNMAEKISKNGVYKIVSLGVALVIWTTTLSERKDAILVRDMDVEFLLRANQKIAGDVNSHVQIKVSGPKSALRRMSQTSRTVSVNLYQEEPGSREVEFSSRMFDLPANVRLRAVRPDRIKVDIVEAPQQ